MKAFILLLLGFVACQEYDPNDPIVQANVAKYKSLWNLGIDYSKNYQRPKKAKNVKFIGDQGLCKTALPWNLKVFDFIVIGGGSSGSIMASRLSENPNNRVLLLEAGGEENVISMTPGAYLALQNSDFKWGHVTVPQNQACLGMINQQCSFDTAKVLGGETSTSDNAYVRGAPRDFDDWENQGLDKWSYEKVLPYFQMMEDVHDIGEDIDTSVRGTNGPLSITESQPLPNLLQTTLAAYHEIGVPPGDYNAGDENVAAKIQVTTKNGQRFSANQAYLTPIRKSRSNLLVVPNALVMKIIFYNKKAVGVNVAVADKCYTVYGAKEIILSAGTVNSPQLLMLSGIGPKQDLQKLNISVISDLPVGKNLQEHLAVFSVTIKTNLEVPQYSLDEDIVNYFNGFGTLSEPHAEIISFISKDEDRPVVEILHSRYKNIIPKELSKKRKNTNIETNAAASDLYSHIGLLYPKSVGSITLNSTDATNFPLIDPNYLNHPDDIANLIQGYRTLYKLTQTNVMKAINATLDRGDIPQCVNEIGLNFYLCKIRNTASGMYHSVGTCKMGNDPATSVVNQNLLVYGVTGLRVVDTSVIPTITSGHSYVVAMMMAEKITDEMNKIYV